MRVKLGEGQEATVFEVKNKHLVEKIFKEGYGPAIHRKPKSQYKLAKKIMKINKKKKLGLNLPRRIILKEHKRSKSSLLISKLEGLKDENKLSSSEKEDFVSDKNRQVKILEKHGYHSWVFWIDNFFPQKTTKGVRAVLADFGTLSKKPLRIFSLLKRVMEKITNLVWANK